MEHRKKYRPFTNDAERSVYLDAAPLKLVISQIHWPEHAALSYSFDELAKSFGSKLEGYPLSGTVEEVTYELTSEGPVQGKGLVSYQWTSPDEIWTVHLNPRYLSLACRSYEGYDFQDVLERLTPLAEMTDELLGITTIERVGVRYINRVEDGDLVAEIPQHFKPQIVGYQNLQLAEKIALQTSISLAQFSLGEIQLRVRSGLLAPGETPDPLLENLDTQAWALDLDAFSNVKCLYRPATVMETVGKLSDTCYDFFKFSLLDEGEKAYGGRQ